MEDKYAQKNKASEWKKEQHKTQANKPTEQISRTRKAQPDVCRATSPRRGGK